MSDAARSQRQTLAAAVAAPDPSNSPNAMRPGWSLRVLLVSTYELGHQPLALASPAAALRASGHEVRCLDLAIEPSSDAWVAWADLIAVSVPMHTAARLGAAFARRARALNPAAHLSLYGLYAAALHELLRAEDPSCSVIGGEPEPALCALAHALAANTYDPQRPPLGVGAVPSFGRFPHPLPDRDGLPPAERYAHVWDGAVLRRAGYVEASRGCAHRCRHCPLTPVYGGRLRLVAAETVLADAEQQIDRGVEHITFGDPDFFNAVAHSLGIVAALHRRHPGVTFDATIKVEHLLQHAELLPRLRDCGCLFVTSAFESRNDEILRLLDKGHTRDDLDRVVSLAQREGIVLRPTWVAFTPWGSIEDYVELLRFVEEHRLVGHVPPVQYTLKLLLPPGSPLIDLLRLQGRLGRFDREGLTWTWTNPDYRLGPLQTEVARIAETVAGQSCQERDAEQRAFVAVKRAALRALGSAAPVSLLPQPADPVPGLTEAWFC